MYSYSNEKVFVFSDVSECSSIIEILEYRASHQPDKTAYIFLADGGNEEEKINYKELDKKSKAIAASLLKQGKQGDRVLLLFPPGLEFFSAFFGCLYAGMIAVPVYPPNPSKLDVSMEILMSIFKDADPFSILSTKEVLGMLKLITDKYPELETVNWIASDEIDIKLSESLKKPDINKDAVA